MPAMPKSRNILTRLIKWSLAMTLTGLLVTLSGGVAVYVYLSPQLPSVDTLKDVRLQVPLRIYTSEGDLIAEYGEKRREPLTIDAIPELLKNAYLAAEDDRFYGHPGVDYQGLLRAAVNLIKTGRKGQGGSTITMQVARNFFLTREKTYLRKINEILLALKIESELSKDEILELYLNKIFLGNRAYGVGAAAKVYYGVPVQALTLAQMAMIAGLPKAPSKQNPIADPERAVIRRNYVLDRMHHLDMIDSEAHQRARSEAVSAEIHSTELALDASYVGEMVRAKIWQLYKERAYTAGLKVYTTLKTTHQVAATRALRQALLDYEERRGYRGALATLEADVLADEERIEQALADYPVYGELKVAVVTQLSERQSMLKVRGGDTELIDLADLKWAGKRLTRGKGSEPKAIEDVLAIGDVVYLKSAQGSLKLAQMPDVEGAFVSLSPRDGAVQSLVGGFDFNRSKFNRVTQAERQPGSNLKPFIYSAALEKGYTAASVISDAPVVFEDVSLEGEWRPENYSGKFFGPTRFREALVNSRNLVSVRLLIDMGLDHLMGHMERFGLDPEQLPRNLSLSLGSGVLKPIQVARGYATFANNGYLIEPYFIDWIEDVDSTILFKTNPAVVHPEACEQAGMTTLSDGSTGITQTASSETSPSDSVESESLLRCAERVLDERNAYIMRSIMRDVIRRGTARRATVLGQARYRRQNGYYQRSARRVVFRFQQPTGRYRLGGL